MEIFSLVGIEEGNLYPEAVDYQLTMYDFQISQMGYLAAHCLLGDIPIRKDRRGIVVCPGRITDRGSVGRMTS